jgi:hypothetical protein
VSHRTRTTTAGLVVAGLAFAAYPALRPYGPETGLAGAADFGASEWLIAHVLGMVGFVSLAFALRSAAAATPWSWAGGSLRGLETSTWVAVALLLPYYGAEAYGLNAVGRHATEHGDARAMEIADSFRYAPFEVTTFSVGLVVLAVVGVLLARGLWHAGSLGRVGGLLAGAGLVTYLPQFFGTPGVRVAHGVMLGAGLLLAAAAGRRSTEEAAPVPATSAAAGSVRQSPSGSSTHSAM